MNDAAGFFDFQGMFDAAQVANARPDVIEARGPETVTNNAISSMVPVGTGDANGGGWSGFLQGAAGRLFDFALARQAVRDGVTVQGGQPSASVPAQYAQPARQYVSASAAGPSWGMLLLLGGVALLAFKAAKG